MAQTDFPTSFGVFSPTGQVVMAFDTDADAERARQVLIESGYSDAIVNHLNRSKLSAEFRRSEEHDRSPLQIGQEVDKIARYLALANEGCGFLVLQAPEDEDAKRAVTLVRPLGLKFAEKYNRLTIEELA